MKKYKVTLYFHTDLTLEVEANNIEEAIKHARHESEREIYDRTLLDNLQEDDDPDVECLEPRFIKADTAGYMVKFPDEDEVFYVGSPCPPIGNGVCYKSKEAFEYQEGICYTPEADFKDISARRDLQCDSELQERLANYLGTHGLDSGHVALDVGYTWDDLRDRVYSWIGDTLNDVCDDKYFEMFVDYIQERMFEELDWQAPATWLSELDPIEQWENCPQLSCDDPRFDEHGNRKQ